MVEKIGGIERAEGEASFNDVIWVQVTSAGERVWEDYHAQFQESFTQEGIPLPKLERDEKGWTKLPMHKVALIFGSHMRGGNTEPPIKYNFRTKDPLNKE